MRVIIPMAGKGTRLRPHTHTKPKPLMFVAGKPVLGHILDGIKHLDIQEAIFIVSGFEEELRTYLTTHYKFKFSIIKQKEALGPAHAIFQAKPLFTGIDDEILIIYADTIFETDMNIINRTKENIIWVKEVEDARRFGIVILDEGKIVDMEEKPDEPRSNLAIVGMYHVRSSKSFFGALDYMIDNKITRKGEYYLNDALLKLIQDGETFIAPELKIWLDCGVPKTILETNRYLLVKNQEKSGKIENSVILDPVFVGKGAIVRNSVIGPYVAIDDNAQVNNSIIRESIINSGAKIKDEELHNSLIGINAEINGSMKTMDIGDDSKIFMKED
jgi:glucose-1-phosphate thymidylyltransferase